jgi:hypothetical protein
VNNLCPNISQSRVVQAEIIKEVKKWHPLNQLLENVAYLMHLMIVIFHIPNCISNKIICSWDAINL